MWVILAGLPEKPETADLGMGDGAEIRKLFLEEEEWWLLLLTSRGRSTPCQPNPEAVQQGGRWQAGLVFVTSAARLPVLLSSLSMM